SEGSIHHFHEVPLFAEDEPFGLRRGEILSSLGICLYPLSVSLVTCQAIECYQTPPYIVRAFIRKKVSHQVPATPRNDSAPIFCIFLESIALIRIDLVTNDADNRHRCSPRVGSDRQSPTVYSEGRRRRRKELQRLAAAHPPGCWPFLVHFP